MMLSHTEPLSLAKAASADKLSDAASVATTNSNSNLVRRELLSSKLNHQSRPSQSTSNKSTSKLGQGHDHIREISACNGYEQLSVATDNNGSSLGTESGR
jgi:hypothetical protein